jgi:hypothetical protein
MDKKEKGKGNKEGDNMQTALNQSSFADFIRTNNDVIKKVVSSNTVKNKDGLTVIAKNDPWRNEKEWDQFNKEIKK